MLVAIWISGTPVCIAQETQASEVQVKAAFIVNFSKYVAWPVEAFAATTDPVVIVVAGDARVAEEIEKVIVGRAFNGRNIVLKELAAGEMPGVCHILYISEAEQRRTPGLLATLSEGGILTVGESDDFLERGGIINLARRDRKMALEVNLAAARNARIGISSKLLAVASVVNGEPK